MISGGPHLELRELVERLPSGAVLKTAERLYLNERAAALTGYSREELSTLQDWMEKLHGAEADRARLLYFADRTEGFPQVRIISIRHKNGDERWIEHARYQQPAAEIWLLRDMTSLWRDQARLNAENKSLKTEIEENTEKLFQTVNQLLAMNQELNAERQRLELLYQIACRQQALLDRLRRRSAHFDPLLERLAAAVRQTADSFRHADPVAHLQDVLRDLSEPGEKKTGS